MIHNLKIWPSFYKRVKEGSKTFEYRKNDRGFQNGDFVILNEWDPSKNVYRVGDNPDLIGYTGSDGLKFRIGFVAPIDCEYVVFSLLPITLHDLPEFNGLNEEAMKDFKL